MVGVCPRAFAWVPAGSGQQVDGDLAERGDLDAVDAFSAVEDDLVVAGGERDVGSALDAAPQLRGVSKYPFTVGRCDRMAAHGKQPKASRHL